MPGTLVVDLGTVSGSAATGDVILSRGAGSEITLPPGLHFLSAVIQTAACTVARYVSSFSPYGTGIYGEPPQTTVGGLHARGERGPRRDHRRGRRAHERGDPHRPGPRHRRADRAPGDPQVDRARPDKRAQVDRRLEWRP